MLVTFLPLRVDLTLFVVTSHALHTDTNAGRGSLSPELFPGVSSLVEIHEGFRDEHAK